MPKPLVGWSYTLPKRRHNNPITLRRDCDGLEVSVGDTIMVNDTAALIKEIALGVGEKMIEIRVVWLVKGTEVCDAGPREWLLTASSESIDETDIANKADVEVFRGYDEDSGCVAQNFDFSELCGYAQTDPKRFTEVVREVTRSEGKEMEDGKKEDGKKEDGKKDQNETGGKEDGKKDQINETGENDTNGDSDYDREVDDTDSVSDTESIEEEIQRKRKSPRRSPRKDKKVRMMTDALSNKNFKIKPILQGPSLSSLSPRKKSTLEPRSQTSQAFLELKAKLHTSAKLHSLPGREDESFQLLDKISTAIETETGSCIYVSGTPGLGKTATIRVVISQLQELVSYGDFRDFDFIEINGLKLLSPNVAYENMWAKVSGYKVSASNAAILLEKHFSTNDPERRPLVVLMDELDQIVTKNQNVMYNFFNWPTYEHSKLVVVAVANTMDLPERVLSNKISSRLGLNRIQFVGYTFAQLGDIIRHRLEQITKTNRRKVVLEPDAVGFASRKVASVSGDARRALTICRRAVEIAEKEYLDGREDDEENKENEKVDDEVFHVKITHISRAITESVNSPTAQFLAALPFAAKLLLQAVLSRKRRSGLAENSLGDVIDEMKTSLTMLTSKSSESLVDLLYGGNIRVFKFKQIVQELVENGILLQQNVAGERYRMISLNVSEEEVGGMLERDELLR